MKQQTLTVFEKYGKTSRRAQFLADMDQIIPWPELTAAVQAVYPKISENGGRPPIPLERILRISFLQLWFNLSDPAVEEALYDSAAMRSFVGVDSKTKLVHTVLVSAANVHDREALPYLLHGNETRVWGDQGYQGQTAVIHAAAPNAKDFTIRRYRFNGRIHEVEKAKSRNKSRVRAKVEHVFGVMKNIFGFKKTRYRGLAKNLNRLEATAALTNLYLVRRRLLNA